MAKTFGPLLSISASGSVGKTHTYSNRKTGNQVRYQRKQKDSKSDSQLDQRELIYIIHFLWTQISATQKAIWNTHARTLNISGYNAFIKVNLRRYKNEEFFTKDLTGTRFNSFYDLPAVLLNLTPTSNFINYGHFSLCFQETPTKITEAIHNFSGKEIATSLPYAIGSAAIPATLWKNSIFLINTAAPNYWYQFDLKTGAQLSKTPLAPVKIPSYLPFRNNHYLYSCHSSYTEGIVQMNMKLPGTSIASTPSGGGNGPQNLCFRDGYIYGNTLENPCRALRWLESDLTQKTAGNFTGSNTNSRTICTSKDWIYTITNTSPCVVYRLDRATMTTLETVNAPVSGELYFDSFYCGGKIFFIKFGSTPKILVLDEASFTFDTTITDSYAIGGNQYDLTITRIPVFRKYSNSYAPRIYVP